MKDLMTNGAFLSSIFFLLFCLLSSFDLTDRNDSKLFFFIVISSLISTATRKLEVLHNRVPLAKSILSSSYLSDTGNLYLPKGHLRAQLPARPVSPRAPFP